MNRDRVTTLSALGLAGAALAFAVTAHGTPGPTGSSGPAGKSAQVSTQDGICYDSTQAPYFYSPTDINGVESCYGGQFISIVPQPQQ